MTSGVPVVLFLFNELAVNVACSELRPVAYDGPLLVLTTNVGISRIDQDAIRSRVSALCDRFDDGSDREA